MKKSIALLLISLSSLYLNAQLTVNNSNTVQFYVQNILLGTGITASNITYNGVPANIVANEVGQFTDPTSTIGLPSGIVLGSGDVDMAPLPNMSGGNSLGGSGVSNVDLDLAAISNASVFDECVIEFDFVPVGDTISFNYVFASEEYEEYVCSGFNDAFGFFLTGNNPSGGLYTAQNIALVPDPLNPGSFTTTPVAINTVNPGVAGSNGISTNCSAIDPNWASYNIYYLTNLGTAYEYDGRTVSLPAFALVNCGETYHIKLAIGDGGDSAFDSGVFLEEGSFSSSNAVIASAVPPGDITLCTSTYNVNFNGGSNNPPYSYWDFGDSLGNSWQTNPNYTYADTGYYQVMYVAIDSASCNIADTVYFDVNLIANEVLAAQMNFPTVDPCTDTLVVNLQFTGTGADSIIWDMGNGTIFYDSTSINYAYTVQGSYVVSMIAFDLACNNIDTITDTVFFSSNFSYAVATAPNDTTLCSPPPYNMSFTSDSPPYSFWDFGDGTGTSTLPNPSYVYQDSGSYQVMYVAIDSTSCNISDTAYFNVTLNQAPVFNAQFILPQIDPCVDSLSVLVDAFFTGSGVDSLIWDMGNGVSFTNQDTVSYTYTTQGVYYISVQAWNFICNNYGIFVDTLNFVTNYSAAVADAPTDTTLCSLPPFSMNFTANGNNPDHFWDFGDGSVSSTLQNPSHVYSDSGAYLVTYIAIDSSTCNIADTVYFNVTLNQAKQFSAELNFDPPPPCGSDSLLVQMAFSGTGADSLIWDMDNGDVFNTNSVSYYYTEPGVYSVSLTAFDLVCNNTEVITSDVYFSGNLATEVIIPNVFTPNGDGENDVLTFINVDASNTFQLTIYNRWGRKVFETTDPTNYWDGTNKNDNTIHEGVFYFEIIYTDICSFTNNIKTGFVHLMR